MHSDLRNHWSCKAQDNARLVLLISCDSLTLWAPWGDIIPFAFRLWLVPSRFWIQMPCNQKQEKQEKWMVIFQLNYVFLNSFQDCFLWRTAVANFLNPSTHNDQGLGCEVSMRELVSRRILSRPKTSPRLNRRGGEARVFFSGFWWSKHVFFGGKSNCWTHSIKVVSTKYRHIVLHHIVSYCIIVLYQHH